MYQIKHFELATQRPVALHLRAGSVIRSASGCVWLTMAGQPDDVWLNAGESWTVTRVGTVWISAEAAAAFQVAQLAAPRSVRGTLSRWFMVRSQPIA